MLKHISFFGGLSIFKCEMMTLKISLPQNNEQKEKKLLPKGDSEFFEVKANLKKQQIYGGITSS